MTGLSQYVCPSLDTAARVVINSLNGAFFVPSTAGWDIKNHSTSVLRIDYKENVSPKIF